MEKNTSSIDPLTGLRFFAAISVAIAHGSSQLLRFDNNSTQTVLHWMGTIAGFGMSLFFVLSGFVIHYNYSKLVTEQGFSGYLKFIWARFSRLYPLFFFVLLADLLINGKILVSSKDALEAFRALPWFILFVQSWFYEVIGSNSLIYQIGWNSPLTWSISTEWFFYLAYLLLAYPIVSVCRNWSIARIVAVILVWIVFFWIASTLVFDQRQIIDRWAFQKFGVIATQEHGIQDSFVRWALYFSPYARLGEFVTGCLVSGLYLSLINKPVKKREAQIGSLLSWGALFTIPVFLFLMYSPTPICYGIRKVSNNIGLAPFIAVLIFCTARYKNVISDFLSWRPIVGMGEASYSIYLVHMLIFVWIAKSFSDPTLPTTVGGIVFGGARFLCVLAFIIILSLGLYTIVEVPARTWLRKMWKQDTVIQWRVIGILAVPIGVAGMLSLVLTGFDKGGRSDPEIIIRSATYGANCGALEGNATQHVQDNCGKGNICEYTIDVRNLGDPAPNCGKDFRVEYSCQSGVSRPPIVVKGEAGFGSRITLECSK
jgi:peptidoglycan/LPS O-acetylase OafA/YrhL